MTFTAWSLSRVQLYERCPAAYQMTHVTKTMPRSNTPSPALQFGIEVHNALEGRLKHSQTLPPPHDKYEDLCQAIDAQKKLGRKVCIENQYALTQDMQFCDWMDKDVWLRAKNDVTVIDKDSGKGATYDWKTGAKWNPDERQFLILAVCTFLKHPELLTIQSFFYYLKPDELVGPYLYYRNKLEDYIAELRTLVQPLQDAFLKREWPHTPSKSNCKWCPALPRNGGRCTYGV